MGTFKEAIVSLFYTIGWLLSEIKNKFLKLSCGSCNSKCFKGEKMVEIEVDLPEETIEWLEEMAEKSEVDFNTYVVGILEEYLDDEITKKIK